MDEFHKTVPTAGYGQRTHEQCWYASFQMMYKFKGLNEGSIEDKLNGAGIDVADAKANGMKDTDYSKAATALGLTAISSPQFKESHWYNVTTYTGTDAFLTELHDRGPLWVSRYVQSGYHIVVATGYIPKSGADGYIVFNNPFPGPTDAIEVSSITANTFCKFITDAKGSVQSAG